MICYHISDCYFFATNNLNIGKTTNLRIVTPNGNETFKTILIDPLVRAFEYDDLRLTNRQMSVTLSTKEVIYTVESLYHVHLYGHSPVNR